MNENSDYSANCRTSGFDCSDDVFVTISNDNSKSDYRTPPYKPKNKNAQIPTPPKPVMTAHASERMFERMNVDTSMQYEMMERAFRNGKTVNNTTGDLKYKLADVEQKHSDEGEVVAKYYNGSIFVFTTEDNVLKTAFPYNVNGDYRHYH